MHKCKLCNKEFKSGPSLGAHITSAHNPIVREKLHRKRKISIKIRKFCPKCNSEFFVSRRINNNKIIPLKKEKNFCSRKCANSRFHSINTKYKISRSMKTESSWFVDGRSSIKKYCKYCNEEISYNSITGICKNCLYQSIEFKKLVSDGSKGRSGGYRTEYKTNKTFKGWYKGFWCESSWELAYIIYCIDNNIELIRNHQGFNYVYNDKIYKFYPDFKLKNTFVEIKGRFDDKNRAKISQFKLPLLVLDKNTISFYIKYAIRKYGKNFINLYENTSSAAVCKIISNG